MSKKNNNNKGYVKPEVEEPVEQIVEKEAIVFDPEVLKAEAPEVEPIMEAEAREFFINEVGETPEKITEVLEAFHNVDAEAEISEVLEKEATKFEFQDEYHFGPGNGDAVIDTLPEEKTREEKIEEIVEAEAQIFDAEEEKFLNSSVEEIEESPVFEDDGECDGECPDKDCPCNNEVEPEVYLANNPVEEEKVNVLYMGRVIKFPKGKDVLNYSRTEITVYLNTGKLPN